MKIKIGGVGLELYEVNSEHEYAKEIADGVCKGYEHACLFEIPKILKDMEYIEINMYLLYLFKVFEKTFKIDEVKESILNEAVRILGECNVDKDIKTRDIIIKNRMNSFCNDDIIQYISIETSNKIKQANKEYKSKIKSAINESLYSHLGKDIYLI